MWRTYKQNGEKAPITAGVLKFKKTFPLLREIINKRIFKITSKSYTIRGFSGFPPIHTPNNSNKVFK